MIHHNLKRYLSLGFIINISLFANGLQAQISKVPLTFETRLTYEARYVGDSTNSESVGTESTYLLINDAMSLFVSRPSARLDSAMYLVQDEKEKGRILSEINQGSPINYKIFKKANRITTYDLLFNDLPNTTGLGFYYDEAMPEWNLAADTSTINGLLCQKATTTMGNRVWTAWFTTEIPISDGPYKFSGLPGLVISVQDEQQHWTFNLRDIENEADYAMPLEGQLNFEQIGNKEKFLAAKRDYGKFILEKEELRTGRKFTADTRGIIEKRLQSILKLYSNWIELDTSN